uniref:Uncharacterized protein n=1 Tax=Siphoviridae sp. ctnpt50 TaxID=2827941 RepID=A0A8S5SEQ5_9CAUD|nr:MAG TPA: hypothetical protein [Siphoviridae sp. ctnpt50]
MGKRNNFKPSDVFMKAYTCTLEKAVNSKYGKSDFRCYSEYPSKFSLNCEDCSFNCSSDDCTNPYFEDGAGFDRTFEQRKDWFYKITGKKDDRPKEMFMEKNEKTKEPAEHTEQETKIDEDNKEPEAKAKSKYEVEYTTLDSDEPKKEYVQKVVDLLSLIKEWNKEAIKWNLIANGNTSKIPFDFKDIHIKVYNPEEGVVIFQDECTLKSKGLKLAWIRDN